MEWGLGIFKIVSGLKPAISSSQNQREKGKEEMRVCKKKVSLSVPAS